MINDQVRRRQIERHCAASIRALSGRPRAEYRRQLLFEDGKGVSLYSPHLNADVLAHSLGRCRGVADAMALRLTHTDLALHRLLLPEDQVGCLVFDILEQLRVECLVPDTLPGMQANLDHAFDAWCRESCRDGLIDNELALVLFAVTLIVRTRLTGQHLGEYYQDVIEAPRYRLAPVIGDALAGLRKARFEQKKYAALALEIVQAVRTVADAVSGELTDHQVTKLRQKLVLPRQHENDDRYVEGGAAGSGKTEGAEAEKDSYRIFCTDYDREVSGAELYRVNKRTELRMQLDKLVLAQAISVPRLAGRLKRLFAVTERSGWNFGEEEGLLDGRRLAQLVSNPAYSRIFKQQKYTPYCDTVVSFLIDNSGSMKRQRFEAVAVMVDIYSRALELAGIRSEILGFTTGGWTGGKSIKAFRAAGMPKLPGRLNDRLHVVYKDADTSWRRARYGIASMLSTHHFREGLDGEALQWADQRLQRCNESRKCLVMISDGAPMDSATSHYNDEWFLARHLKRVVERIETESATELNAIGIGLDMAEFFSESIALDLTGTLGNNVFSALELLFSKQHRGGYRGHRSLAA